MGYLVYVVLLHDTLVFVFGVLAFRYSSHSAYLHFFQKSTNFTPMFAVYLIIMLIWSLSTAATGAFLLIFWRSDIIIYNARIMFILGLICNASMFVNICAEILLCIDRCFAISFPRKYSPKAKQLFCYCSLICIILMLILHFLNTDTEIPNSLMTSCQSIGCITSNKVSGFPLRTIVTGIEAVLGVVLFSMVKIILKNVTVTSKIQRLNSTVIIIVLTAVILDFLPPLISQSLQAVSS